MRSVAAINSVPLILSAVATFNITAKEGMCSPPLNLAHMRTLDPSQRSQLLLGNFLILAKRAHSFTESQGWLGFIGLCLGDDLVEQYASALAEASSND